MTVVLRSAKSRFVSLFRGAKYDFASTLLFALIVTSTASAQVQLDRFYPPVVSIGGDTTVTAEGKFPTWPVQIVCDRKEIRIDASKDSGKLQVNVVADTAPGIAWIRLHDQSSASKLVPLLIEPQPPVLETEPNNKIAEATKTKIAEATATDLPSIRVGRLEKSGDVDTYQITVRSGQTLVISATAHRLLRSPMDAVLQLADPRGNVIVQSDDDCGLDPQIVYEVTDDAELYLRIFAFPETPNSTIGFAGSSSFVYMLRLTTGPFVDHLLPLVAANDTTVTRAFGWNLPDELDVKHLPANNDSPRVVYVPETLGWQWQSDEPDASTYLMEAKEDAPPIARSLPCVFSGHIETAGDIDRLRFQVEKGKKYRAAIHSHQFGFTLDSVLRIVNAKDDSELARNDDQTRAKYDAVIEYSAKSDAEVELQVSDLVDGWGPRHAYSVVVEESKPTATLTLENDHYAVKAGETLEIPVTIARLRGFKQKLRVTAEGLPKGVTAEAMVSETKGDSAKSVKLKLTAEQSAVSQGTIRIVGHSLDENDNPTGDPFIAVHALREIVHVKDVWLTVAAAKP